MIINHNARQLVFCCFKCNIIISAARDFIRIPKGNTVFSVRRMLSPTHPQRWASKGVMYLILQSYDHHGVLPGGIPAHPDIISDTLLAVA